MAKRSDPRIDRVLVDACRTLMLKYRRASESLVMSDETLEELTTLVRPICDWPRERIRKRVITLRKSPPSEDLKMPGIHDLFPPSSN